jgi:hypothetical protein
MIPGQGFEPRFYGPEPHVLPVGRPRSLRHDPFVQPPQALDALSSMAAEHFEAYLWRSLASVHPRSNAIAGRL